MLRDIRSGPLYCVLFASLVCLGPAAAMGEQFDEIGSPHSAPVHRLRMPVGSALPHVATQSFEPAEDLGARVADLEARLEAIDRKKTSAKKKAAGRPSVKVGGRLHLDAASFSQNDTSRLQAGEFRNGHEFRGARLKAYGDAFDSFDYIFEVNFAGATTVRNAADTGSTRIGQIDFKNVYIGVKDLPWLGNVRVGHFKRPFSMEALTSDNHTSFLERSLPASGLPLQGRSTGIMAFDANAGETFTWAIGAFATDISASAPWFANDSGGASLATRYTFLPWYDEASEGRRLIHTGIAYTLGDVAEGRSVRFRQRPEAHLATRIVDTGSLADVSLLQSLGLEGAFVNGPFSVQAEYYSFWANRTTNPKARFDGAYAFVSYFLTGEHRVYKRGNGTFGRVKPRENFFRVRDRDCRINTGKGAWEVLYRISYLDLNGAGTNGGLATDHTLGLSWYLNPYVKTMFNYVRSNTTAHPAAAGTGRADLFLMRFQIDF